MMQQFLKSNLSEKASIYFGHLIDFVPKGMLAIIILIFGMKLIQHVSNFSKKGLEKFQLDPEIRSFLYGLIGMALKVFLFFILAGVIGIETAKFVAVLGAAVFTIGMGLQGSLGHFAAGLLILIFKPYRVGDVVEIQGKIGTVKEIQLINTDVLLFDNTTSIIPNGLAISDIVTNFSNEGMMRVDTKVYMPYSEDFPKVEKIILEVLQNTPKVLSDPKPFVGIDEFESHSVGVWVWPYAKTEDYWDVYFDIRKNIKNAFHKHGIEVAYSEGVELGKIGA